MAVLQRLRPARGGLRLGLTASGPVEPVADLILREAPSGPVQPLCARLTCPGLLWPRALAAPLECEPGSGLFCCGQASAGAELGCKARAAPGLLGVELAAGAPGRGWRPKSGRVGVPEVFVVRRENGGESPLHFWLPSFLSSVWCH